MLKVVSIFSFAIKMALLVLVVGGALAFLGAPVLFGVAFITASVVMTVWTYTALAFCVGLIFKWLAIKRDESSVLK